MKPAKFKGLSYRTVVEHYGLILCDNHQTCKRRWSKFLHDQGRADLAGNIHWSRADYKMTRRGLRELLVAMAAVFLKHDTRPIPKWLKLYEANTWAWKEGRQQWRVDFTQQMSWRDREKAARMAKNVNVRTENFAAYQWMRGRGNTWKAKGPVGLAPSTSTRSSETSSP